MSIVPALLRRRRFYGVSPLAIYAVLGFKPELVLDFDDEKYFANSTSTTFSDALTHSASSNATMVDSDGLLKWRPHNLALNSASPATQSITVVSGADYTVECTGVSIALSGAGSGTVTEGSPVTITASTTTLTLTVTGSSGTMWAYRSDLGGMVDNPDRGDSYVPTTSSAVYLPRRGHHVYNGTSWVNEGLLHESEARTNLLTYSETIQAGVGQWSTSGGAATLVQDATLAPSGETQAVKLSETATTSSFFVYTGPFFQPAANVTASCYVKAAERNYAAVQCYVDSVTRHTILVDLTTGAIVDTDSTGTPTIVSTGVQDVGNGWYRAHVSLVHTSGNIAIVVTPSNTATPSYISSCPIYGGTSGSGIYIWGAQLEAASTPSSYIPTSGATVTRAAETLTIPSAKLPYSATAMSIQMQGRATGGTLVPVRWYLDANNYITQEINTSDFTFEQAASGTVDAVTGGSFTSGVNTSFNIASRHGSTFVNGAVDGTALTANTTPTALPDLSATDMNLAYVGGPIVIKSVRMWAADITDAGLEAATV